jgi:hypothetical protein
MSNPQSQSAFRKRALELSTVALHSAQLENWARAATAVKALNDELGGEGIMFALAGWCDTLIVRQQEIMGGQDGDIARPAWLNATTGEVALDADDVPPPVRWAGRLVAARAALDHDAWDALIASIPDAPMAASEHVSALLNSVAMTLNGLSRMENGGGA